MARKAANVVLKDGPGKEVVPEEAMTPEQRKAAEKVAKRAHEEKLQQIRVRFGKIELPMRRSDAPPKYCVMPEKYDALVREVAEERGYAICIGKIPEPAIGFSLHVEKPEGAERIAGPDPSLNKRARLAALEPRFVPKVVKMPGIPIIYAVCIHNTSPDMGSVSMNAERHFDARHPGRDGREVSMGLEGPYLHIRAKKGEKIDYLLVPMTNVVKAHPDPAFIEDREWGVEKEPKKGKDDDEEAGQE